MKKQSPIKTSISEIVSYWEERIDESDLSIDFSEAHERCWRCGYKSTLQRCHIIPDSLEGEHSPCNLVLLCRRCHIEAPNINNKEFFWDWLKAQKSPLYDTYWSIRGIKEYELIYKVNLQEVFKRLNVDEYDFKNFLSQQQKFVAIHFGEGRLNPSTIAGIIRSFVQYVEKSN